MAEFEVTELLEDGENWLTVQVCGGGGGGAGGRGLEEGAGLTVHEGRRGAGGEEGGGRGGARFGPPLTPHLVTCDPTVVPSLACPPYSPLACSPP